MAKTFPDEAAWGATCWTRPVGGGQIAGFGVYVQPQEVTIGLFDQSTGAFKPLKSIDAGGLVKPGEKSHLTMTCRQDTSSAGPAAVVKVQINGKPTIALSYARSVKNYAWQTADGVGPARRGPGRGRVLRQRRDRAVMMAFAVDAVDAVGPGSATWPIDPHASREVSDNSDRRPRRRSSSQSQTRRSWWSTMSMRRSMFEVKRVTALRRRDRMLREYVRIEGLSHEEVLSLQRQRAIDYARFAVSNTTFYRDFYRDAGITLADLDDPDAFASLPVVTKDHVRENFEALKTPEATEANSVTSMTGGSTGQPLHSLVDSRISVQPMEWRLFRWWGVHPYDNIALVARQTKTPQQKLVRALKWWPSKRMQLDAYQINERQIREFVARWVKVEPELLTGYAGGILELARTVQRLGLEMKPPVAIATTASPLTEEARGEIQSVLRAPVYDHYRSSEIPFMGGECRERTGHHVFAESRVVEIVGPDNRPLPAGGTGEVLATDLTNRVFPLIRYRLGDHSRALPEPCPCGISLPRIDHVRGRATDGLRLPDGTWVAGEGLYQVFSKVPGAVLQYQLDQRADHSVMVRCVRGPDSGAEAAIETAVEAFRDRLGRTVPVQWELVDQIPHEGGKIRYIRSAVV